MFGLFRNREAGFRGGLTLDGHKLHGEAGRIQPAPLPRRVILPLSQHIGAPTRPLVEVGERVLRGQCIADSDSFISAPVHASISGTVVEIAPHPAPHPSGLSAPAIVIESDGKDEPVAEAGWPACEDPFSLDGNQLRERVRLAGLVGLGGAAFPSSVKLNPGRSASVDTLILNGVECEPYISCDAALMQERAEEIIAGAELIRRALDAENVLIGLEDNAPDAATALRQAITRADYAAMDIRVLPTRYPQGGEKQLIQALTGKEVPSEGLPLDIGIVVHNVGTVAAIWRAIRQAQPLTSRIVTVTGPGLAKPRNLEVRLGTPVADLIAHCGGYTSKPRLIMGGPMMGFALSSDQVPIVKGSNCVLVEVAESEPDDSAMPCIRCGECVDVCPASLLPQQLYWHARAKSFDKAQDLNLFDCIECGCCAQVCPSNIPLVQYYRYAKTEIYQAEQEKRKADIARNRHEFRLQRLENEAREKEEARRRKREALKQKKAEASKPDAAAARPAAGNDAIAKAIAKAKAEKAQRLGEAQEQQAQDASASPKAPDAIADAIAKAKAAKAAKTGSAAATAPTNPDRSDQDPVAAAIARAKASKAGTTPAKEAGSSADDPVAAAIARAKAAKAARPPADKPIPETDSASGGADPVALAIAKAKAAKAGDHSKPHAQTDTAASESDPVAQAIARAKATKAVKNQTGATQDAGDATQDTNDPVAAAIAKAKAARAGKRAGETEPVANTRAGKEDAVAAAIAKARAAKATPSPSDDAPGATDEAPVADDPVAAAIARAKAAKAAREKSS